MDSFSIENNNYLCLNMGWERMNPRTQSTYLYHIASDEFLSIIQIGKFKSLSILNSVTIFAPYSLD